jgi:hypothetical protein
MVAIAHIVVAIGSGHVIHASTTEVSESLGGSSRGGQLSPGGRSAEMISDRAWTPIARFSSRASARTWARNDSLHGP